MITREQAEQIGSHSKPVQRHTAGRHSNRLNVIREARLDEQFKNENVIPQDRYRTMVAKILKEGRK